MPKNTTKKEPMKESATLKTRRHLLAQALVGITEFASRNVMKLSEDRNHRINLRELVQVHVADLVEASQNFDAQMLGEQVEYRMSEEALE